MQPINQSNIIASFNAAQSAGGNLTITPAQFFEIKSAIARQFLTYGIIVSTIGFAIGIYVGYSWAKRKYDCER
jgi:uncharacterized membrane protein